MPEEIPQPPEQPEENFLNKARKALGEIVVEIDAKGLAEHLTPIRARSINHNIDYFEQLGVTNYTQKLYYKILDQNAGNLRNLSYHQKLYLLLRLGLDGSGGYDTSRRNDITSRKNITLDEFLKNNRARYKVEEIASAFEKQYSYQRSRNEPISETALNKLFQDLSDASGVSVEKIRQIYKKNEQDTYLTRDAIINQHLKLGVCGDIHKFIAQLAENMGFTDAATINTSWQGSAHVVSLFKNDQGKFVIINYNTVIETHTSNPQEALSILEQNQQGVALQYTLQNVNGNRTVIQSAAGKQMIEIASGVDPEQVVNHLLETGLKKNPNYLHLRILPGKAKLELSHEFLAGATIISITRVRNENIHNPVNSQNSIGQGQAIRLGQEWTGETFTGGLSLSAFQGETKQIPLYGKNRPKFTKAFIQGFFASHHKMQITEEAVYSVAAYANTIFDFSLNHTKTEYPDFASRFSSALLNFQTGQRLDLIDKDFNYHLQLKTDHAVIAETLEGLTIDPRSMDLRTEQMELKVGAKWDLGTATAFRAEAFGAIADPKYNHTDFQTTKVGLAANLEHPDMNLEIKGTHQKSASPFIQDTKQIGAEFKKPLGKDISITIYGLGETIPGQGIEGTGGIRFILKAD